MNQANHTGPSPTRPFVARPVVMIGSAVASYAPVMPTVETDRLIIRHPTDDDRPRFVELFTDEAFSVFGGVHDATSASARFDRMLAMAAAIPYAKQPIIERASGAIIGYSGVDSVEFEGLDRLEWGWRLVPEARGRGYATEATEALLTVAGLHSDGEILCLIAAENHPSRRVADKLGFRWWRRIDWDGDPADPTDLLIATVGSGGPPLVSPL